MIAYPMLRTIYGYLRDQRGAAAAEFAIFVTLLAPLILNVVDLGMYIYQRLQLEDAAQAAAQAAWATCSSAPASACGNMNNAIAAAIISTPLGSNVHLDSTTPGYYCPDASNKVMTAAANATTACPATGMVPGYYVTVTVSFDWLPVFGGATIASAFTRHMTRTTWTRIA